MSAASTPTVDDVMAGPHGRRWFLEYATASSSELQLAVDQWRVGHEGRG